MTLQDVAIIIALIGVILNAVFIGTKLKSKNKSSTNPGMFYNFIERLGKLETEVLNIKEDIKDIKRHLKI